MGGAGRRGGTVPMRRRSGRNHRTRGVGGRGGRGRGMAGDLGARRHLAVTVQPVDALDVGADGGRHDDRTGVGEEGVAAVQIGVDRDIERPFVGGDGGRRVDDEAVAVGLGDLQALAVGPVDHRLLLSRRRGETGIPLCRRKEMVVHRTVSVLNRL